ncbi:MAG: hypothetical protein U1F25_03335 [Rubrivivax sp.]
MFGSAAFAFAPTLALAATPAAAREPTTEPLLRVEAGMHTTLIRRIAVDAPRQRLVTASDDKTVRVWQMPEARLVTTLRVPIDAGHEGQLFAVAVSPDGRTVATGGWTGWDWDKSASIYFFDIASGQLVRRVGGFADAINALVWTRDGEHLLVGLHGRGGVHRLRLSDQKVVASDTQYLDKVMEIDERGDGPVAVVALDGMARLYGRDLALLGRRAVPGGAKPRERALLARRPAARGGLHRPARRHGAASARPRRSVPAADGERARAGELHERRLVVRRPRVVGRRRLPAAAPTRCTAGTTAAAARRRRSRSLTTASPKCSRCLAARSPSPPRTRAWASSAPTAAGAPGAGRRSSTSRRRTAASRCRLTVQWCGIRCSARRAAPRTRSRRSCPATRRSPRRRRALRALRARRARRSRRCCRRQALPSSRGRTASSRASTARSPCSTSTR